jgi:hypothetical protein
MQNKQIENQKEFRETNNKDAIRSQILEGKKLKINVYKHNKNTRIFSHTTKFSNFSSSC